MLSLPRIRWNNSERVTRLEATHEARRLDRNPTQEIPHNKQSNQSAVGEASIERADLSDWRE